jgi:hypothetical protein
MITFRERPGELLTTLLGNPTKKMPFGSGIQVGDSVTLMLDTYSVEVLVTGILDSSKICATVEQMSDAEGNAIYEIQSGGSKVTIEGTVEFTELNAYHCSRLGDA